MSLVSELEEERERLIEYRRTDNMYLIEWQKGYVKGLERALELVSWKRIDEEKEDW